MIHFLDGLNSGESVGEPKNNGLLREKNIKGVIHRKERECRRLFKTGKNDDFEKFS